MKLKDMLNGSDEDVAMAILAICFCVVLVLYVVAFFVGFSNGEFWITHDY